MDKGVWAEQLEQDSWCRTTGTGQPGQHSWYRTAGTGQAAGTRQPGLDIKDKKAGKGHPGQ